MSAWEVTGPLGPPSLGSEGTALGPWAWCALGASPPIQWVHCFWECGFSTLGKKGLYFHQICNKVIDQKKLERTAERETEASTQEQSCGVDCGGRADTEGVERGQRGP